MTVKFYTSKNRQPKTWSGGTTTELFIYPPTAEFKELNFDFRLSTATVEIEESVFTPLPNVSRTLMILDGEMTLAHENHHTKQLQKLDFDCFEGGWKTVSKGKCTDFNLMTMGDTKGTLKAVQVNKDEQKEYALDQKYQWAFLYLSEGAVTIRINSEAYKLTVGDLLAIEKPDNSTMQIMGAEESEMVLVITR